MANQPYINPSSPNHHLDPLPHHGASLPRPGQNLDSAPTLQTDRYARTTGNVRSTISRNTKAHLKVATLNMNGRGSLIPGQATNKWNPVHALMRDKKIGILALQETHLTAEFVDQVEQLYGKRLVVVEPRNRAPSNARGVAFLLNREITNVKDFECVELIPDRAILLKTTWHNGESLRILNVYAPNNTSDNEAFWAALKEHMTNANVRPDVLLGDFNLVTDACDRMPPKMAYPAAVVALQNLLEVLDLRDGWRESKPHQLEFTYPQNGTRLSASRLDRIYVTEELAKHSLSWDIDITAVPTDHKLASVSLAASKTPYIGRGRWQLNASILSKPKVLKDLRALTIELEDEVREARSSRTQNHNPQTVYATFKTKLCRTLRQHSKVHTSLAEQKVSELKAKHDILMNDPDLALSEEKRLEAAMIQERIYKLEMARHAKQRLNTAANVALTTETNSKYWTHLHKERKPRDILFALRKLDPDGGNDPLERRSDRMAEIARDHHDRLQRPTEVEPAARRDAMRTSRNSTTKILSKEQSQRMDDDFTEHDVRNALKSSSLGKASGLDGITYELWKKLDNLHTANSPDRPEGKTTGNVLGVLATVFSDIQTFGIHESSTFTEGWMCPIYKQKGDRLDIASYRPITLLNSDYKLMTKVIASRLASVAPTLIHPDQAGFIPGRRITDQTILCQQMIDFAEAAEEDGLIVALDQEKAYDKISHDYLWKTLKQFGFSSTFISTIRNLYKGATTRVVINGEMSTPYVVTRGVRQGDPMSCILFDLAIEPLACMLRNSDLHGYEVPGCEDRLITKLFADDTTVYLSCDDSLEDLMDILDTWCLAADAKFNISKTKIIPIGSKSYRATVVESRIYNTTMPAIPSGIAAPEVVPDGKATRILGAFLGNDVNQAIIWEPILEKIKNRLEAWRRSHPSMKGKALILQMVVGGMTQYLAAAQGMPTKTEEDLTKVVRNFMWDDRQPKIGLNHLQEPLDNGGLNLLDLRSRNEAIALVWLKTFLMTTQARPTWAFVADALLERSTLLGHRQNSHMNGMWQSPFLQSWTPPRVGKNKPRPMLAKMMDVARRYRVKPSCIKPSRTIRKAMPAWLHIGMRGIDKFLRSRPTSRCLRQLHRVRKMADVQNVAARVTKPLRHPAHFDIRDCTCVPCSEDRECGCKNPARCVKTAADILKDLSKKWDPNDPGNQDGLSLTKKRTTEVRTRLEDDCSLPTLFDPSLTTSGDLSDVIRAFTSRPTPNRVPLRPRGFSIPGRTLTVAVALERMAAWNIWQIGLHADSMPPTKRAWSTPGYTPRMQVELRCVAIALEFVPIDVPLVVVSTTGSLPRMIIDQAPRWEDENWTGAAFANELKVILSLIRARTAPTRLQAGTRELDTLKLAQTNLRLQKPVLELPDLPPARARYLKDGMRLSLITQATAYREIKTHLRPPQRRAVLAPLDMARLSWEPTEPIDDSRIWRTIRDRAFPPRIQTFLWKNLHSAFGCGQYWANIPGRQSLEMCPMCGVTESMEHILFECSAEPVKILWNLARSTLAKKGVDLPRLSLGHLLGLGLVSVRDDKGSDKPGATRLLKIVLSETAYLIWKLRCERRIEFEDDEGKYHSARQISSRWLSTLTNRLHLDAAAARSGLACWKPSIRLVLATWSSVLENEHSLDDDWTPLTSRVLVGMEPRRRQLRPLRISVAGVPGTRSSPTRSA